MNGDDNPGIWDYDDDRLPRRETRPGAQKDELTAELRRLAKELVLHAGWLEERLDAGDLDAAADELLAAARLLAYASLAVSGREVQFVTGHSVN